jgi:large subunit ribosomal protein L35
MPKNKMKTHKGTAKRIWKTKRGTLRRRQSTQAHFNARETSGHTRAKRNDSSVNSTDTKRFTHLLPYKTK